MSNGRRHRRRVDQLWCDICGRRVARGESVSIGAVGEPGGAVTLVAGHDACMDELAAVIGVERDDQVVNDDAEAEARMEAMVEYFRGR
jgi:hypothetical protein